MAFLPNYVRTHNAAASVKLSGYQDYEAAFEDYAKVLEAAPNDVEALVGQGNAHTALGQYDRAIISFDRAIELAPNSAEAFAGRGIAYTKRGDHNLAIVDFQETIELDEGYGRGDYAAAYASPSYFLDENIISFAASYLAAHTRRGEEFLKAAEFDRAIKDFTIAIEFPSRSETHEDKEEKLIAYACRGVAFVSTGEYEQGISDLDTAENRDEALGYRQNECLRTSLRVVRGIAYARTGDFYRAYDDFINTGGAVLDSTYMDSEAYVARGLAFLLGNPNPVDAEGALREMEGWIRSSLEEAILLDRNNVEAYVLLGIVHELRYRNDEAVTNFQRAIETDLGEFETQSQRLFDLIGTDLPAHNSNVAIAFDDTDPRAYLGRALAYIDVGEITPRWNDSVEASVFADFNKALELDPSFVQVYIERAEIYLNTWWYERARADLEKALRLDPTNSEARERLDWVNWLSK
ncbi:MAG: tetratricopeptide repeat protein [Chloroflexi bacterium]|nr:tetratricopeptide repeat protein [Chloroflexota bacterium]